MSKENNIDEVLESLRTVKNYCKGTECKECPFLNRGECGLSHDTPNNWIL